MIATSDKPGVPVFHILSFLNGAVCGLGRFGLDVCNFTSAARLSIFPPICALTLT
jgi:hypothetical protein